MHAAAAPADLPWDWPRPFTLALSPCEDDIDELRHTNNAVYVRWCEQAGWAHSAALGLAVPDYHRLGRAMVIRQAEYDYLLPSLLGDELLLGTWISASDGKLTMRRRFQLVRPRDGATVLRGRWELVCVDLQSGRPRRLPQDFVDVYLPVLVSDEVRVEG
ncbi:thioesterase family protein [Comamonas faecalis]|uniref:Thioesterase family protein n=1 Tax=Comamonas faecalis TaxID=1387849 RepID=A0ABP7R0Y5_9BURK